jgi:2OG-Fe(II) oxygenase superfamily
MKIFNLAGPPILVLWKDRGGEYIDLSYDEPIINGTSMILNSFGGHEFLFKSSDSSIPGEVPFVKDNSHESIVVYFDEKHEMQYFNELVESIDELKQKTLISLFRGNHRPTAEQRNAMKSMSLTERTQYAIKACADLKGTDDFHVCFLEFAEEDFEALVFKKEGAQKSRSLMSERLRNYTCADDSMETTKPLYVQNIAIGDDTYKLNVMLNTSNAKIFTVDGLVSDEECNVLREFGLPNLRRATVADEDGTAIVSEHRKAQQARYRHGAAEADAADPMNATDPLYPLYVKIFNITNAYNGYDLEVYGQESFMIIQYNKEDEYTAHCDGSCDDDLHTKGGRIATAVVYCHAPTRGGATTFTKADVFVRPTNGSVVFFSYMGADGYMDPGHTEHSSCPILEGEKWIATVWMRRGVSREEPQTLYDPSGGLLE